MEIQQSDGKTLNYILTCIKEHPSTPLEKPDKFLRFNQSEKNLRGEKKKQI